jgi:hypothetical protein
VRHYTQLLFFAQNLRTKGVKNPVFHVKICASWRTKFYKNRRKKEVFYEFFCVYGAQNFLFTAHKNLRLRRTNFLKKLPLRRTIFWLYGAQTFGFTAHKSRAP